MTTEWNSPARFIQSSKLQRTNRLVYWMATAKHFSACAKSGIYLYALCSFPQGFEGLCEKEGVGGKKGLPAPLPFFPLVWNKAAF